MKRYGPVYSGSGRLCVGATAHSSGANFVVSVQGGERAHVGAVALACPSTPTQDTAGNITCYASVLTAPGHRDDILARTLALQMCHSLQTTVSLSVGIHIDHAEQVEIAELVKNAETAVEELLELLQH